MDSKDLKDIIIELIRAGLFYVDGGNEENAIQIAKFEKAYYEEIKNKEKSIDPNHIDTSQPLL